MEGDLHNHHINVDEYTASAVFPLGLQLGGQMDTDTFPLLTMEYHVCQNLIKFIIR